jgi:hypothetical protein
LYNNVVKVIASQFCRNWDTVETLSVSPALATTDAGTPSLHAIRLWLVNIMHITNGELLTLLIFNELLNKILEGVSQAP